MTTRTMIITAGVAFGLFAGGAVAQHEEHHQDQSSPQTRGAQTGEMMPGGMMSQMPRMMMGQNETNKLVDQLLKSFAAIEAEKDPDALAKKLAEHGALLRELQTKIQAQSHMMDMMQHMMSGSMMGGGTARGETRK